MHTILPTGGEHARQYRLGHQEHAAHVDGHQPVPLVLFRFEEGADCQDAGVIEENGDRAEGRLDRLDCGTDLCRDRDIRRRKDRLAAVRTDGGGHLFAFAARQVDDADLRTFTGEEFGGGKPAASGPTTDQRHFSRKPACHRIPLALKRHTV